MSRELRVHVCLDPDPARIRKKLKCWIRTRPRPGRIQTRTRPDLDPFFYQYIALSIYKNMERTKVVAAFNWLPAEKYVIVCI